jgi:hypothetical protein
MPRIMNVLFVFFALISVSAKAQSTEPAPTATAVEVTKPSPIAPVTTEEAKVAHPKKATMSKWQKDMYTSIMMACLEYEVKRARTRTDRSDTRRIKPTW